MTTDHLTAHVDDVARIRHREAMELTATENQRLLTGSCSARQRKPTTPRRKTSDRHS